MVGWSRLPALSSLRHTYIALRHGQSTANVAGVISSDPAVASVRFIVAHAVEAAIYWTATNA